MAGGLAAAVVALGCPVLLGAMMWAIMNGMRREVRGWTRKPDRGG